MKSAGDSPAAAGPCVAIIPATTTNTATMPWASIAALSGIRRLRRIFTVSYAFGCDALLRPHVAIQLMADRQLVARQTRRVLLQQLALRASQAGGVVLAHLRLERAVRRGGQRHVGVDGARLRNRRDLPLLRGSGHTREAGQDGNCRRRKYQ